MAQVTVGVPTYNGETHLEESLLALAAQDHSDFQVIVLDNASSDRTAEIAQDMCGSDPRFAYHSNPVTIPVIENFRAVWSLADSPYFLWRADDDLSATNYLSELTNVLQADPEASLAVGNLERRFTDRTKFTKAPNLPHGPPGQRAPETLLQTLPYWIYGMWRNTGVLEPVWDTQRRYGWLWAWDHLAMLPTLIAGRVTCTQSTTFIQRVQDHDYYVLTPCEKLRARKRYKALAQEMLAEDAAHSAAVAQALETHIEQRVARLWSTRRRCLSSKLRLR